MKRKIIIISIGIILLLGGIGAGIFYTVFRQPSLRGTPTPISQPNDSAAEIKTYLQNVPPDHSLDQDMAPLDEQIKNF
jgi:hypothetical protein